jgi:hypothetical protein
MGIWTSMPKSWTLTTDEEEYADPVDMYGAEWKTMP